MQTQAIPGRHELRRLLGKERPGWLSAARAVALARHYRESDGLSIAQIAARPGRAPATVKAYFYDPS